MVLGKWNQADQKTVLKNTKQGVALDLRTKGPALAVNNSKRIKKLNADKLDGRTGADYKTNRNTLYSGGAAAHTGGFSQAIPPRRRAATWSPTPSQIAGAAGDPGNPNVINCRIVQSGVSGTVTFDKAILGRDAA